VDAPLRADRGLRGRNRLRDDLPTEDAPPPGVDRLAPKNVLLDALQAAGGE
jgi:hypothetical protein